MNEKFEFTWKELVMLGAAVKFTLMNHANSDVARMHDAELNLLYKKCHDYADRLEELGLDKETS